MHGAGGWMSLDRGKSLSASFSRESLATSTSPLGGYLCLKKHGYKIVSQDQGRGAFNKLG